MGAGVSAGVGAGVSAGVGVGASSGSCEGGGHLGTALAVERAHDEGGRRLLAHTTAAHGSVVHAHRGRPANRPHPLSVVCHTPRATGSRGASVRAAGTWVLPLGCVGASGGFVTAPPGYGVQSTTCGSARAAHSRRACVPRAPCTRRTPCPRRSCNGRRRQGTSPTACCRWPP